MIIVKQLTPKQNLSDLSSDPDDDDFGPQIVITSLGSYSGKLIYNLLF